MSEAQTAEDEPLPDDESAPQEREPLVDSHSLDGPGAAAADGAPSEAMPTPIRTPTSALPPTPAPRRTAPSWRWTSRDWWVAGLTVLGLLVVGGALYAASRHIDTAAPPATTAQQPDLGENSIAAAAEQPVTIVGAVLPGVASPDPAIGAVAPTVTGYSAQGRQILIGKGDIKKMVVIVSPQCGTCGMDLVRLVTWRNQGRLPDWLEPYGITTGTPPAGTTMVGWMRSKGFDWFTIADSRAGDAARAYGATQLPMVLLLAGDDTVLDRLTGTVDLAKLDAAIAKIAP